MSDHDTHDHTGITGVGVGDATAHIADATDAHDASAISFSPTGTIAATDVQAAIAEVASEAAAGGIPATIVDAKGDIIAATAADTVARVAVGANGTVLEAASGATPGVQWDYPPGYEFDYAEITSNASITNTGATPDTAITGASITYDGSTIIIVEFFCGRAITPSANNGLNVMLYDGASAIGTLCIYYSPTAVLDVPILLRKRLTPTAAAHQYSIRAWVDSGTGTISAGAGTTTTLVPAYMRITKV